VPEAKMLANPASVRSSANPACCSWLSEPELGINGRSAAIIWCGMLFALVDGREPKSTTTCALPCANIASEKQRPARIWAGRDENIELPRFVADGGGGAAGGVI